MLGQGNRAFFILVPSELKELFCQKVKNKNILTIIAFDI